MISFRNFALRRGERLLLSDVDLALHAGYRVGVVGRNGAGKSSLFAALMGDVEPDRGDIDLPGKARIASVAQETPHLPNPALDFVLSGDAEVHAAVQAEANAFANEDWEAVAEAHQRLEEVNGYDGTLLVISHDREFLDNVTTHILHLHDGKAKLYVGNYTAFERQRAEHLRQQQIAHDKEQAERAHLQSFIDRFKAKASKARQAQSRMKRLEKLAGTEAVRVERGVSIQLPTPARLPNSLLSLRDVDCGYGADAVILHNVGFGLESGDRIGLLGVNGAGKSTLVKTRVGELPPMSGERVAHPDLRIGYFAQHTVESLVMGTSPIDHLKELAPNTATQEFRNFLGGWQFPGDRAFEVIDNFSGGEKARLALALLAWNKPNLLLLDEPTNHLDLEMREALAEALSDFEGAIVMVSHDRHLIGLVSDQYWRVHDGIVEPFDGDLDDYAAWLRTRPGADNPDKHSKSGPASKAAPVVGKPVAAPAVAKPKINPHKLEKAEARVKRLEEKLAECEALMVDPAVYADAGKVADLGRQQLQLRAELEGAEAELLALYD